MAEDLQCLKDLLDSGTKHASYSEYLPGLFVDSVQYFIEEVLEHFHETDPSKITVDEIKQFIEGHSEYEFLLPFLQ
ncbi:hypothetical protein TVAG_142650 [Trichomonas vaginalis G3]|uniref:Uncharacterized protein n=1 Tax=Trichomonas vaginalis (strain ATCC PRA-98 / G3) TaxID=412133 RepID=A2FTJ1_TRIV3|nr:hypothetical protein TVAGG3_0877790 [Trichomonas vaginalis G3]EAX91781.1 hypothetical protein TVAG_142650 [Trichomonas vaginalis G3]KAI5501818.1 hypothetical protein TVAGG3_0877790 [Trichomonas vaginalis G3]|eukprot:XP_001304711.1 hypothetical protein [Trichomonas vaginalis G3]